jgi:Fe-S-cluster-containing dehydrogenase component
MALSRRDFFKIGGSAGMAVTLSSALAHESVLAAQSGGTQFGVLIDVSRCIGCRSCEKACLAANHLPAQTKLPGEYTLSGRQFSFVDKRQIAQDDKQTVTRFVKRQCMHCLEI